jgi:hypothetical protein
MPPGLRKLLRSTGLIQVELYAHLLLEESDGDDMRYGAGRWVTLDLSTLESWREQRARVGSNVKHESCRIVWTLGLYNVTGCY